MTDNLTDVQRKLLGIACNANRENSLREQYDIVRWAELHLTTVEQRIVHGDLGWDTKKIRTLKDLLQCDTLTIDIVLEKKIHAENAKDFSNLSHDQRSAFLDFFCGLQLSQQYEREFMEWLPEIAYTQNRTVADILLSPVLQEYKNSTALNAPQKIQKIREYLFSCKFPRYAETLDAWKKCAHKTFPNPSKITLTPNPFFEKDKLELRISVATAKEAHDTFGNLAAIPGDIWTQLICPYK